MTSHANGSIFTVGKQGIVMLVIQLLLYPHAYAGNIAIPAPPSIDAEAYLLQDFQSTNLIVSKNIEQRVAPASLTKMMTAYIVGSQLSLGYINLDDLVLISEKAWNMRGSRTFIEVGKNVLVSDLLMGVIIQSGNDASVALAEHISGSEESFAKLMNRYAEKLDMENSHFKNSTGLPDTEHYTTAKDMAKLAIALIRDMPDVYALHSIKEFTYNGITQKNRNKLLWYSPNADGIKTGHTDAAGFCLVASEKMEDMRLISVVMGTKSDNARIKTTQSLLRYGFRFYETQRIYEANKPITTIRVWKGDVDTVELGVESHLYATFPRGSRNQINEEFVLSERYFAPVNKGVVQGTVKMNLFDNRISEANLITLNSVDEGSFFTKLKHRFQLFFE